MLDMPISEQTSRTIIFHNPGELDIRAVTTFGLSVKKSDNPIGQFGTGLKYAIAVALRHGCDVEICAGRERYHVLRHEGRLPRRAG